MTLSPPEQDSQSSALYYLMKYGYIHEDENSNTAALLSADGVKSAIKDFQVRRGKHLFHARLSYRGGVNRWDLSSKM